MGTIEKESVQYSSLVELADQYEFILLDAYGVFWGSSEVGVLPGAREAMAYLVSRGKQVGILSNTTQLSQKMKEKFSLYGLMQGEHYHFLLTSGEISREWFQKGHLPFPTPRKRYMIFSPDHPRFSSHLTLVEGSGLNLTQHPHEADFILITIPHNEGVDQETEEVFVGRVKELASYKIPVICPNPDHYAHEGEPPRLVVRQGLIASLFESHGGKVYYIGKPFPKVYERALELFSFISNPDRILMIGDTPEIDIKGAKKVGMATALVTKSGIMKERIKFGGIGVIAKLEDFERPDFYIKGFSINGI